MYSPGAIQEGIQRIPLIFRYLRRFPTLQERVRLVHEKQQPLATRLRPLEELVDLRDGIPPQGRDVASGQYRELEPGVLREAFREHGLARARRSVEEEVAEGRAVLLRVSRRDSDLAKLRVEAFLEDDAPQRVLGLHADARQSLGGRYGSFQELRHGDAGGLAYETRFAQPCLGGRLFDFRAVHAVNIDVVTSGD